MDETSEFLLLEEVARRCRVPVSSVRHWIKSGRLESVRFARRRLVRRADLELFIASSNRKGRTTPSIPATGLDTTGREAPTT